jgi:hypothetical protein
LRHAAHAITTGGQAPSFGSTFFRQRQELTQVGRHCLTEHDFS